MLTLMLVHFVVRATGRMMTRDMDKRSTELLNLAQYNTIQYIHNNHLTQHKSEHTCADAVFVSAGGVAVLLMNDRVVDGGVAPRLTGTQACAWKQRTNPRSDRTFIVVVVVVDSYVRSVCFVWSSQN